MEKQEQEQKQKQTTRIIKLSGDSRLNQVHGCVTANSLSQGPKWIEKIYDAPARVVMGRFGKSA